MRIFIDESGNFGSSPPQISLHCGVVVCSTSLVELFRRFLEWKHSLVGNHRKREIKANVLDDDQLESFVRTVILPEADLRLTVVGIDTNIFTKPALEDWRDGISHVCQGAAEWSGSRGYPVAKRQYTEMSGWLWNRSPDNLALMISLGEVIWQSLQNSIICFGGSQFESEFCDLEIVIDRSFIRRHEHELFWNEFLRSHFKNRSRREPLLTPDEWSKTNHPFERQYCQDDDQVDLTTLFREHMYFADSKKSEGLQIADICAHICLRYYRRRKWFEAYRLLRKFITGEGGRPMTLLIPTGGPGLNAKAPSKTQQEVLEYAKLIKPRSRK